jgi:predicted glycosyltransferase
LAPLISSIRAAGMCVRVTARPQAQTLELARLFGIEVQPIGGGDKRGTVGKVSGVLARSTQLAVWVIRQGRPLLLVSSSRTACLAAALLRVRSVALLDYEHAEHRSLATSDVLWLPDLLREASLPTRTRRVAAFYEGLKENLYLDARRFDRNAERAILGVGPNDRLVVSRPPADGAHYASPVSGRLWFAVVRRLLGEPRMRFVVIPRTKAQGAYLRDAMGAPAGLEVLDRAVDGPALVAAADLVVGGGGTMNREAAVLGTHVWSVFSGPRPAIDEALAREGRLTWITREAQLTDVAFPPAGPRAPRGPFPDGRRSITSDIFARLAAGSNGR